MPRKIGAKGWSALLAYPRLASTTRSCSFCLSVNKRSSMDRSLGPALPLLLLPPPLLLLLLSSLLVASLSPFPNAICNSSLYFFEPRLVVVLPSDEGRPFLIARVYKLPGTAVHACLAFTRELRCGRIVNRNCGACFDSSLHECDRIFEISERILRTNYLSTAVVVVIISNNKIKNFATSSR